MRDFLRLVLSLVNFSEGLRLMNEAQVRKNNLHTKEFVFGFFNGFVTLLKALVIFLRNGDTTFLQKDNTIIYVLSHTVRT